MTVRKQRYREAMSLLLQEEYVSVRFRQCERCGVWIDRCDPAQLLQHAMPHDRPCEGERMN